MQRARLSAGFVVLALIAPVSACASTPPAPKEPRPSTSGHDDVAGRDDDPAPPPATTGPIGDGGNRGVRTFDEAKRALLLVYGAKSSPTHPPPRDPRAKVDLYCGCSFLPEPGKGLVVDLAGCGYTAARDPERAKRIEWEHAIPAAAFGRTFKEWIEGDDACVDGKGKRYKGRNCARRNAEFARIEADLHNLFPVVGEVNGIRGDLPMGLLESPERTPPHHKPTNEVFHFGRCQSAIERGVFLPRREVRGDLARAHLYMDAAYPERRLLDDEHRALMKTWSSEDPPDEWERERNRAIGRVQGNANGFIAEAGSVM